MSRLKQRAPVKIVYHFIKKLHSIVNKHASNHLLQAAVTVTQCHAVAELLGDMRPMFHVKKCLEDVEIR